MIQRVGSTEYIVIAVWYDLSIEAGIDEVLYTMKSPTGI